MPPKFTPLLLPDEQGRVDYRVRGGRRAIIAVGAVNLALALGALALGREAGWIGMARVAAAVLLTAWLYRGLPLARAFAASALSGSAAVGAIGAITAGQPLLLPLAAALVQVGSAAVLLASARVAAYLSHRRATG